MYDAIKVSKLLGIAKSTAYKFIKQWNSELADMGQTVVRGKIPKLYFEEKNKFVPKK